MMKDSSQFESLVLAKLKNLASPLFESADYTEESFQAGALLYNSSLLIAYSASEEGSVLSFVLAHHEVNDDVAIHLVVDQESSELYEQVLGFGLDVTIWVAEGKKLVKHPHAIPYQRIRVPEKAKKLVIIFIGRGNKPRSVCFCSLALMHATTSTALIHNGYPE